MLKTENKTKTKTETQIFDENGVLQSGFVQPQIPMLQE